MNKIRGRDVDYVHNDLAIIKTDDGSHTLYHCGLDEIYHSLSGALSESTHVFIHSGLLYFIENFWKARSPLNILEVGWGTGLNALLTMKIAVEYKVPIQYVGLEPYPLPQEIYTQLNYSNFLGGRVGEFLPKIHELSENVFHPLTPFFSIKKVFIPLLDWLGSKDESSVYQSEKVNLVYFDAFGITKQSDLWEEKSFIRLSKVMEEGAILVTYACNRSLKQYLQRQGLKVESVPGASPKREMTRAIKLDELSGG